jgi:hypothetical protein
VVGYLISFFYFGGTTDLDKLADSTGREGLQFFADSGAYSAHSRSAPVSLSEYAAWLRRWEHRLSHYINLDVKFDMEAGNANQAELERLGFTPAPVFHLGEPLDQLRDLCDRYDFVTVGNIVNTMKRDAKLWGLLDLVHAIAAERGTGLHGLGLSSWPLIRRWPWRSVDASSMGSGFRYGVVHLFDFHADRWRVFNAGEAHQWHRYGWLLREYGFDPAEFAGRDRKAQRVPLLRLAGATWQKVDEVVPGMDFYIVDGAFAANEEGTTRLAVYERGAAQQRDRQAARA